MDRWRGYSWQRMCHCGVLVLEKMTLLTRETQSAQVLNLEFRSEDAFGREPIQSFQSFQYLFLEDPTRRMILRHFHAWANATRGSGNMSECRFGVSLLKLKGELEA